MILALALRSLFRSPRRLLLEGFAVAFPVAVVAATLGFVDANVQRMTRISLSPVQIEMRALATSLDSNLGSLTGAISHSPGVARVDRFASAAVLAARPGATPVPVRLFAVDPPYLAAHPWVRLVAGDMQSGLMLTDSTIGDSRLGGAQQIELSPPGGGDPIRLPVDGQVDLHAAATWFQIPAGQVFGDVAVVPRTLVVAYPSFERLILPALRQSGAPTDVTNPGLTDLPPLDVELHIGIDHGSFPADPQSAASYSSRLRRQIEDLGTGSVLVTDNAAEALGIAQRDATNARVMFLLLGLPGVLVAGALGLVGAAVLSQAYRRERALLELRGATTGQMVRLSATTGALSGAVGAIAGLAVARLVDIAVLGRPAMSGVPLGRTVSTTALALLGGFLVLVARVGPDWRRYHRGEPLATERKMLEGRWQPSWLGSRWDTAGLVVGVLILAVTGLTGGLNHAPVEGQTLALAFYVLLAPLLLWLGLSLLTVRVAMRGMARITAGRPRSLPGWGKSGVRWLARRPGRALTAMVLGVLAVAAGTEIMTFAATYRSAARNEAITAFGADLRLTPLPGRDQARLPGSGPLRATTPIRYAPARAGNGDRKSLLVVDTATYASTLLLAPDVFAGRGPEALRSPRDLLASRELAIRFSLRVGDSVTLTLFPDDPQKSRVANFKVAGIYRLLAPSNPFAEAAIGLGALPAGTVPNPDFYLARTTPGTPPRLAQASVPWANYGLAATTIADPSTRDQRGLTGLSLDGLSLIEAIGAALAATVGVGLLGAFVVVERAREFATLRSIGIETRRLAVHPAVEMGAVLLVSVLLGVPLGIGLAIVAVRVMPLFFLLPPPLVSVPWRSELAMIGAVMATGMVLTLTAVRSALRAEPARLLRG